MRSMKLLAAMAMVVALVAGPALAQETEGTMAPATSTSTTKAPTVKHHSKKGKRHKKSTTGSTSTTGTTSETAPAK